MILGESAYRYRRLACSFHVPARCVSHMWKQSVDARLPRRVSKIEFGSAVFSGNRVRWLDIEHFDGGGRSGMDHSEA
jgi:hypothetical protein